jgi:HlyD family secretion protein
MRRRWSNSGRRTPRPWPRSTTGLGTLARSAERRETLAAKGFLPLEKRDELRDDYTYYQRLRIVQADTNSRQEALRVAQLPQVKAQLSALRQSLQVTRSKLNNLLVRAPVSGRLTSMNLKLGQNLRSGERLAEITLDTGFKVSADVDEFYLGRVQVGQTATTDLGGARRTLRVARVYPEVKNGVFVIDLEFAGERPTRLLPGEAVQGKLSLGGDRPAVLLTAGPFLESSGGDWAFVLAPGGGQAQRRPIKLGRRNTEQVEVLSGLRPGERVVISDVSAYEDVEELKLGS